MPNTAHTVNSTLGTKPASFHPPARTAYLWRRIPRRTSLASTASSNVIIPRVAAIPKHYPSHDLKLSCSDRRMPSSLATSAFFTLPREVRDMMYRELFARFYLIVWPTQWDKSSPRGYHPPFADITLLLVSRAISEEAISVMCKKSVFVLDLDYYVFDMTQRPSQHIMNRMLNVDIKFNLSIFRELAARNDGSALAIWKHCLEGLAGSHLHRDVCQITITCSIPKQPDITTSPFFQVFKRFLEIRIVSFMFICPPKSFSWNINRNDCFGGYHPRTRQTGHWMEVAPEHRSR